MAQIVERQEIKILRQKEILSLRTGFEPVRIEPNGFQVHRLNQHSKSIDDSRSATFKIKWVLNEHANALKADQLSAKNENCTTSTISQLSYFVSGQIKTFLAHKTERIFPTQFNAIIIVDYHNYVTLNYAIVQARKTIKTKSTFLLPIVSSSVASWNMFLSFFFVLLASPLQHKSFVKLSANHKLS